MINSITMCFVLLSALLLRIKLSFSVLEHCHTPNTYQVYPLFLIQIGTQLKYSIFVLLDRQKTFLTGCLLLSTFGKELNWLVSV